MGRLPSRPTRRLIVSLLPEIASFVVAAAFAHIGSDVPLTTVLPVLLLAIVLALVAEYYVTYKPILNFRDRELSTFFEHYLSLAENHLESFISEEATLRTNIMLLESKGEIEFF